MLILHTHTDNLEYLEYFPTTEDILYIVVSNIQLKLNSLFKSKQEHPSRLYVKLCSSLISGITKECLKITLLSVNVQYFIHPYNVSSVRLRQVGKV